jgi:hypothetical protein
MPLIEELAAEHERLTDLAAQVRRAVRDDDAGRARDRFGELVVLLMVHTAAEEAGVYAALRAVGELGDQVDALLADHASARQSTGGLGGSRWEEELVLGVIAELETHIAREEYDLFPATLLAIPPAGWDAAEQAAAQVRRDFAEVAGCAA